MAETSLPLFSSSLIPIPEITNACLDFCSTSFYTTIPVDTAKMSNITVVATNKVE